MTPQTLEEGFRALMAEHGFHLEHIEFDATVLGRFTVTITATLEGADV